MTGFSILCSLTPLRRFGLLAMVLAFCTACMPLGEPVASKVRLSDSDMVLTLSDGTTCRAEWAKAPVGRLDRCGPGFGYAVTELENRNVLRSLWEGMIVALGAGATLVPMAKVVITDPAGVDLVFVSPPDREQE